MTSPSPAAQRLSHLRTELANRALSGFIVPLTDEHMSEYVGDYAKRLEWLTGFSGSAGTAVVLADKAALFVDGRYTLQARAEVEEALYEPACVPDTSPAEWLATTAAPHSTIGYDPWFHTAQWVRATQAKVRSQGIQLVALPSNPLDTVWPDQPAPSLAPAIAHDAALAGRTSAQKRTLVAQSLRQSGGDYAVIAALDSIAWLLNIRGRDVAHTPVARAFALIDAEGEVDLFIEPEKITPDMAALLAPDARLHPRTAFLAHLARHMAQKRVLVDPHMTVAAITTTLTDAGATLVEAPDPCALPKAIKTTAEIDGTRAAHLRDGAALSRFLCWLHDTAPQGTVTELDAEAALLAEREATGVLQDLSFPSIAGSGPHGAIVHYRSSPKTNRTLGLGELFLIDSGGQYQDGTTDVTRTLAIGPPPPEARTHFTLVLKGHIALARARFPKGTRGGQLDTLARMALWTHGLDYDHGTGHGVGSYLAVHEGPQRIAKVSGDVPLAVGMILSNEPGYYKTGAYGIRIENLVLVQPMPHPGDEREMLGFETLTLAPIDTRLIDLTLLDPSEREWLNAYHARVAQALAPLMHTPRQHAWLLAATAPVSA